MPSMKKYHSKAWQLFHIDIINFSNSFVKYFSYMYISRRYQKYGYMKNLSKRSFPRFKSIFMDMQVRVGIKTLEQENRISSIQK